MTKNSTADENANFIVKECPICIEFFDQEEHIPIHCSCGYEACTSCIKKYILNTIDLPHCMSCRILWSKDFLYQNFERSFLHNDFKKHKTTLLLNYEMSQMIETQPFAEIKIEKKKIRQLIQANQIRTKNIQIEISKLNTQLYKSDNQLSYVPNYKLQNPDKSIKTLLITSNNLQTNIHKCKKKIHQIKKKNNILRQKIYKSRPKKQTKHIQKFIHKCSNDECKGFLSKNYQCGLCKQFTCPHCLDLIHNTENELHSCNPTMIETASLIKNQTKPCPNCGIRITRIKGCSQMWCTNCNTGFHWKTLEKIHTTTNFHNPHFIEWVRQSNSSPVDEQEIDCTQLIPYYLFYHKIRKTSILKEKKTILFNLYRTTNYLIAHIIPYLQTITKLNSERSAHNKDVRIKYLMNKITHQQFSKIIYQREHRKEKNISLLMIFQIFVSVSQEQINHLFLEPSEKNADTVILLVHKLTSYCNKEFLKIGTNYDMGTYQIPDDYNYKDLEHMKKM